MNKVLKATHSYYLSQRDILIAELEIMLNKSSSDNLVNKVIGTIEKLALTNSCISTIEAIIEDNPNQDYHSISELLAQRLSGQMPDENNFDEENQKDKEE